MQRRIQGYKFSEKELANESRSELVSAKALPKKKGDVTLYWQNYEEAALDEPPLGTCAAIDLWLKRWVNQTRFL